MAMSKIEAMVTARGERIGTGTGMERARMRA
jgi:hypothetical protein